MGLHDIIRLAREVEDLRSELGMPKENRTALKRKENALDKKNEDNTTFQTFFTKVVANWQDASSPISSSRTLVDAKN